MSQLLGVLEISGSGLSAERLRMEAAAQNIANAMNTSSSPDAVYRPLRVITEQVNFAGLMGEEGVGANEHAAIRGVQSRVALSNSPARLIHDPEHPLANEQGNIYRPGIQVALEMTEIMMAVRAYEANVKAVGAARQMFQSALRIGSGT